MRNVYKIKLLCKVFIPLLKLFAFDIKLKHHWIDSYFKLNTFKHKGYWYHGHGRERERLTMLRFKDYISEGMSVVEVGGHIGYISQYFANLVGSSGAVYVFEPGINNLPYIKENISGFTQVTLLEKCVGDYNGEVKFYIDDLTGQNNSVLKDFEGLKLNASNAFVAVKKTELDVPIVTLDSTLKDVDVDFIKIDIEGGEFPALYGAKEIIGRTRPTVMVEIQKVRDRIFDFFSDFNYSAFTPNGKAIDDFMGLNGNVFYLPNEVTKK